MILCLRVIFLIAIISLLSMEAVKFFGESGLAVATD